ncbi:MAG: YggT family protein [Desulfovibrionales bacterium]|nr:YggT family protein [Desulfovibrionales bacterium]
MEIFAMNFVVGITEVLNAVLNIYFWIVIASALLSWVNPDPYNPVVRILRNLTEPAFYRIRKWLPFTYFNGLDLSPIVLLLAIQFAQIFIIRSMYQIAGAIH